MSRRYYRIQEAEADWADLLKPDRWVSTIWSGDYWLPCPECGGEGEIMDDDAECDEEGYLPMLDCPKCGGTGQIDDSTRQGLSVCGSLEDLYRYFAGRHAELTNRWVVELEGDESEDEDWDADDGALLIYPTRVVSVWPLDPEEIRRREEE